MLYTIIYFRDTNVNTKEMLHLAQENYGILIAQSCVKKINYVIFGFRKESDRELFLNISQKNYANQ